MVAVCPVGNNPGPDAAQILDQGQAQHDRYGPQFAKLQDGHRLVGGHETAETFRVRPPITVRDNLQRNVEHAWQSDRWFVLQARQFQAVPLWQVSPGGSNLFFNQIEVVEQPFPGRHNPAVVLNCRHQQVAGFNQDTFILGQTRQKPVRSTPQTQLVRGCQRLAVLLHLFAAEQFRAQRRLVVGDLFCQAGSAEMRSQIEQGAENPFDAHPHFFCLLLMTCRSLCPACGRCRKISFG